MNSSSSPHSVCIGLAGLGNVGAGVFKNLEKNRKLITQRTGADIRVKHIAVRDLSKSRDVEIPAEMLSTSWQGMIDDPEVSVIVELIGGTTAAHDLVCAALRAKKIVITGNKALLAERGQELFALAEQCGVPIYFEAAVAGGIPIIQVLQEGLVGNHIRSIHGIINGTCNYILTRMENEGLPFDQVLKEAQDAGFAEAEPSLDIDGHDTAHKAALLASLAYGFPFPLKEMYVEGIRGVAREDIAHAAGMGYRMKLLAVIKKTDAAVSVRVHPALVPQSHMLASVSGVFNAVLVSGDIVDDTLYYGRGAGRLPTASAVISDIAAVARQIATQSTHHLPAFIPEGEKPALESVDDITCKYYLRVRVADQPGVLAQIASILGERAISIATMIQQDVAEAGQAEIIMTTHAAREQNLREALAKIDALETTRGKAVRFRIEDFD